MPTSQGSLSAGKGFVCGPCHPYSPRLPYLMHDAYVSSEQEHFDCFVRLEPGMVLNMQVRRGGLTK